MVTLLPLAYFKMPESVAWLASRGRMEEARAMSERTGVPMPEQRLPRRAWGEGRSGRRKGRIRRADATDARSHCETTS